MIGDVSFPRMMTLLANTFLYQPHTCQCTQCRKQTGCLIATFLTVHPSELSISATINGETIRAPFDDFSYPGFKEFASSETGRRGFCSNCGSSMFWRDIAVKEEVEIFLGTVDEEHLIGNRTERVPSEQLAEKGGWGKLVEEEKKLDDESSKSGKPLRPCIIGRGGIRSHYYMRNAVAGVTDGMEGNTWVEVTQRGLKWGG